MKNCFLKTHSCRANTWPDFLETIMGNANLKFDKLSTCHSGKATLYNQFILPENNNLRGCHGQSR